MTDGAPLPFEVLGRVSPILAWTEGENGSRLPANWGSGSVPFGRRERDWLLRQLPSYSYDNVEDIVRAARDGAPKGAAGAPLGSRPGPSLSPPPGYDLLEVFRFLYYYFFVWNGTELCVRAGRMEDLHETALRLPAGHFVRHGHARAISEGALRFEEALELPELVTLLPSNSFGLRSIVRRGLSESHLHMTAVISAEETWADNLLRPRSALAIRGRSREERRLLILNFFAGRVLALALWASWATSGLDGALQPARLLRLLDQLYFARSQHEEYWATVELSKTIRDAVSPAGRSSRLLEQLQVAPEYHFLLRWLAPTAHWLATFGAGQLTGHDLEDRRERYRLIHRLHLAAHLRLIQLSAATGASKAVQREGGTLDHERRLTWRRSARTFLHEALFRYLVCRTHHWQQATQQGRTTGLRHFREYYGSPHRSPGRISDQRYADLVFDRLREWRGLRDLEGRVSPPYRAHDLAHWVRAFVRRGGERLQKFGLVVHFKKEDEAREDRPLGGWSHSPSLRLRWGRRRRVVREEGLRLFRLLQGASPVSPFVVGIDACNLELATPPEVFAPVFRFLRELPITVSRPHQRYSPHFGIDREIRELAASRRLGMTFHVGEDFRHLLSGLRAIDEVVTFLAPQPGDRLGHGTALALQPEGWLERNGYEAVLPKLEWLDTLVWVHHFLGPGDAFVGELAIEDHIQRLSWEIYTEALRNLYDPLGLQDNSERGRLDWDWSPLTLWDAWSLRQLDPYSVDTVKLLRGKLELREMAGHSVEHRRWHSTQSRCWQSLRPDIGSHNAFLLLGLYWMSSDVRRRGAEPMTVDMRQDRERWLEVCRRVGEKMKRKMRDKELVVEVNPSSNRIIGPMERYAQHHVFQLTLDQDRHLRRDVRVSINTDNPAVCNTTLAHEYYLLGEVLTAQGVAEAEVMRWLEWLRSNGEEYNFARRLKRRQEDPAMNALISHLEKQRPSVLEARSRGEKLAAFWEWRERVR